MIRWDAPVPPPRRARAETMNQSPAPVTAYVGLGANLGPREQTLRAALDQLAQTPSLTLTRVSSFHETAAVGGPPDSPPFLNAAAELHTALSPEQLLDRLLEIERSLGRVRREKWEPRLIDLDLLLYGDAAMSTDRLTVPHPLMHRRRFVLEPLAEIAPQAIHPVRRRTVRELLAELP
jgi:2-amino-4-hydroxy-6-hydroxymethyldihydropteridine diphosphokinase